MAFILEEDRIVSGGSISHAQVESRFCEFLRVLAADRKKYACRMISVLQQCSLHMEVFTCLLRS
jgi:hypothetical protein